MKHNVQHIGHESNDNEHNDDSLCARRMMITSGSFFLEGSQGRRGGGGGGGGYNSSPETVSTLTAVQTGRQTVWGGGRCYMGGSNITLHLQAGQQRISQCTGQSAYIIGKSKWYYFLHSLLT